MNQNNLKEENMLLLLSLNNIIIPEIQREYVWGKNNKVVEKFLKNIEENTEKCENCKFVKAKQDLNIGFLYSYKPPYTKLERDRYLDEYLIDGQQRFTTLFLLLLFLSVKEDKVDDFLNLIRFNSEKECCSFDYKVRNLTHNFLIDLLKNIEKNKNNFSFDNLKMNRNETLFFDYNWFLSDYKEDITIQSMLKTFLIIKDKNLFGKEEYEYYDYILTKIKFWHFKTEITSQGEELYITMNSRGESLSQNENQKGFIITTLEDSQKWEEIQDFFWKYKDKDKNENADKGFNEFLNCTAGLLNYYENKNIFLKGEDFKKNNIDEKYYNCLDMEHIFTYYEVLKNLYDSCDKQQFKDNLKWIDYIIKEIKDILNNKRTNWFCEFNNPNNGDDHNKMVFMWFVFLLLEQKKENVLTNKEIRALRYIWLRYNNYDRSVTKIKDKVNMFINAKSNEDNENEEIEDKLLQEEEKKKYEFLRIIENNKFNFEKNFGEKEKIIWSIENHKLNLNAKYLNFTNISHLIYFDEEEQQLQQVKDTFFCLFPEENNDKYYDNLVLLSLFYDYDSDRSTNFSAFDSKSNNRFLRKESRKFIREIVFKKIFNDIKKEYIKNKEPIKNNSMENIIKELLNKKQVNFLKKFKNETNLIKDIDDKKSKIGQIIVYYILLKEKAVCFFDENKGFAFFKDKPEITIFKDEQKITTIGKTLTTNRKMSNIQNTKIYNKENPEKSLYKTEEEIYKTLNNLIEKAKKNNV